MESIKGKIVTPRGVIDGCVAFENGRITQVAERVSGAGKEYDFGGMLVVPGFYDIHQHGLGEYEMFETSDVIEAGKMQLGFGTTAFLPSMASLTVERYIEFGHNIRQAQKEAKDDCARILGAHYEGPFINAEHKGGMNADYLRPMNLQETQRYLDEAGGIMKMMTLSPELQGSEEVIKLLKKNGVVVSMGHTAATPEDVKKAIRAGVSEVCHLYNTFDLPKESEPGIWGTGLVSSILASDELNCEVICDMYHVPVDWVKFTANALAPDRFIAITDALQGAGLPLGEYMLDGREFTTREGVGKLVSNGTVVGSIITMNKAFANLIERCGIDIALASRFTSTNQARVMGMGDVAGSIEVGKLADIAVLDGEYNCVATFVEGKKVYGD